MKPKAIVFGLDGATFTVMDDLVRRGLMPNFQRFQSEGARAKLMSTVPPLTPPAWTSLVTGRSPGNHGVTGFMQYADARSSSVQIANFGMLTAETIWSMANRDGKRAGSLNFVAHHPAPKIDGWVVPGWLSWRWMKLLSHPAGVIDRLKRDLPGFDVKRLAIDMREEKKAIVGTVLQDHKAWIYPHIERERQWFNVLCHLQREDPVDLIGVVFDGVDKLQHLLWSHLDPALEQAGDPEFLRVREMVWEYFRRLDAMLGETMQTWGDEATIIICSDHGFTGSWEIVYLNSWLEKMGYLAWKPEIETVPDGEQELDDMDLFWSYIPEKTKAYVLNSASNGIFINVDGKRGYAGLPPEQYDSFRRELTDALLNRCVHPETGERLVQRVYTREEIFSGPHLENAPDLTLTLRDFGFVSTRRVNQVYAKRPTPMGTHHPEGIVIARGPGIRQNITVDALSILDVAPMALFAMDVPIPENLEGQFRPELYQPEFLKSRAPKRGSQTAAAVTEAPACAPPEDLDVLEKMKALGYLE